MLGAVLQKSANSTKESADFYISAYCFNPNVMTDLGLRNKNNGVGI